MDKKLKAASCKPKAASHKLMYKEQTIRDWKAMIGRFAFFLVMVFVTFFANAQDTTAKKEVVDMATGMRSNGKIYVVVAVLCIILAGVFIYLVNLDKKISKLEKEVNTN